MTVATRISVAVVALAMAVDTLQTGPRMRSVWPDQGHVPTAAAAIAIAVRLWSPIYGEAHIAREKPYRVTLNDGVWTVMGSVPQGAVGGAAVLKIRKSDGKVLLLWHYK